MKNSGWFFLMIAGILSMTSCSSGQNYSGTRLKTKEDTVSYYLGITYGTSLKDADVHTIFNYDAFGKGIYDATESDTLPVSEMELSLFLSAFFEDFQVAQLAEEYEEYITENKSFLEANAIRDSVVSLPDGLQYAIITEGNGPLPGAGDMVKVNYTGWLIDGTKFDSSIDRGEPAVFGVGDVIQGWSEILQQMPVGSKWKVWIPADLAYGANSPQGSAILPFSTLIFEIDLMEINPVEE